MTIACTHFVGFRDKGRMHYVNAVRVFGKPDFMHMNWDRRGQREIHPSDTVVFARGEACQAPSKYNGDDEFYQ